MGNIEELTRSASEAATDIRQLQHEARPLEASCSCMVSGIIVAMTCFWTECTRIKALPRSFRGGDAIIQGWQLLRAQALPQK